MKPMKVAAGEGAPEVDALIEKAKELEDVMYRDDSSMSNVSGVEATRPMHYWTNGDKHPVEDVKKTTPKAEDVTFVNANPHEGDGALDAHVTGDDSVPVGLYTIEDRTFTLKKAVQNIARD
tara:strand:+ start:9599 stop:9961 length:363 start_codon:yes stop_codon:yes gene_type:complete